MSDVKIGLNQTARPAPLGWRKFMNAYIIAFMPAITVFIATHGFTPVMQAKLGTLVILSGSFIKGLGMVLGNGQIYSPSNQVVEDQKAGS